MILPYLNGLVCRPLNRPTSKVPEELENTDLDTPPVSSHAPFVEESFIRPKVDGFLGAFSTLSKKVPSSSYQGVPISPQGREAENGTKFVCLSVFAGFSSKLAFFN